MKLRHWLEYHGWDGGSQFTDRRAHDFLINIATHGNVLESQNIFINKFENLFLTTIVSKYIEEFDLLKCLDSSLVYAMTV